MNSESKCKDDVVAMNMWMIGETIIGCKVTIRINQTKASLAKPWVFAAVDW